MLIGVVLAGGKSRRMGCDKARLLFRGIPLINHMRNLLTHAGVERTVLSGAGKEDGGIQDRLPFSGPAQAMKDCLAHFRPSDVLLFVPVDMPLLTPALLRNLVLCSRSAFYTDHPLPACLRACSPAMETSSVKDLLEACGAVALPVQKGQQAAFVNVNTPQAWKALCSTDE